jgi:hypothetical protein
LWYCVQMQHVQVGVHVVRLLLEKKKWSNNLVMYYTTPHVHFRTIASEKKNFRSFNIICRKPHMASSICLRGTILQNPEGTLWTHCTSVVVEKLTITGGGGLR